MNCKNQASSFRPASSPARRCAGAIYRSPGAPGRDTPVASASTSSGKTRRRGTPGRKARTGSRSLCGRWKKYIFATTQARDAREQRRVRVDRDGFRQKWKRPFGEKVTLQYLETSAIAKPEICDRTEKTPDGLVLALC